MMRLLDRALVWFYPHLMCLVQGLVLLRCLWRRRKEPLYGHLMWERLGFYAPRSSSTVGGPLIWIHAVSLGETLAASRLLQALRLHAPSARYLLTHSTATGWSVGTDLLQEGDQQSWLPWDCPHTVERFLLRFRPQLAIMMETELWPVMVRHCRAKGIPLALVNARMSLRSAQRFAGLPTFFQPMFASVNCVLAQTPDDAQRLRSLACPQVLVCGNLKDDARPNPQQVELAQQWRRQLRQPVLLLASSHEGEEKQLLTLLTQTAALDHVHILLVPRHPHRFAAVRRLCQQLGFAPQLRSAWGQEIAANAIAHSADISAKRAIWIGDSIGEMALYYSLADVALLGGSFIQHGGQNLLEALACDCPVWSGPHTWNFKAVVDQGSSAAVVFPRADMLAALHDLLPVLHDRARCEDLRQRCREFVAQRGGVGERMALALIALLPLVGRTLTAPTTCP